MVSVHVAYTAPLNPSGVTPVLTQAQVWKGLQRKVRNAHEFVPVILECEVLEENKERNEVIRQVKFKEGSGPPGWVKETCIEFDLAKVDFHQENGSTISNIISNGPSGEDEDLHMTYVFEWIHPEVEAGSKEAIGWRSKHKGMAKMAVDKSIDSIRRMVSDGTIQ